MAGSEGAGCDDGGVVGEWCEGSVDGFDVGCCGTAGVGGVPDEAM